MSRVKVTKVETEQKVSPPLTTLDSHTTGVPRIIFIIPPRVKSVPQGKGLGSIVLHDPIIEDVEALCKRLEFRL